MKKKFVIAASPLTQEQSERITSLFRDRFGWWHWINGFWLVTDSSGTQTAAAIRDSLDEIAPGVRKLVLDVTGAGNSWAGFGPKGEKQDMFKWIRGTWSDSQ